MSSTIRQKLQKMSRSCKSSCQRCFFRLYLECTFARREDRVPITGIDKASARELRAVERSVFRKRFALWGGLFAVVASLGVLLVLQSWWLADLEEKTAIARKATMRNILDAIAKDVNVHYLKISERALNLPPEVFQKEALGKTSYYFKKKEIWGAKRLFVVSYPARGQTFFYEPKGPSLTIPEYSDETLAVWAATAPWKILVKKDVQQETTVFSVDERDPSNRIIINPITNEKWKIVGLAGMIVDQRFFEDELLPKAITVALHDMAVSKNLVIIVRDHEGRQVYPTNFKANKKKDIVRRSFQFVFTDWTIAVQGHYAAKEDWARTNFVYNMTLSGLLAIVVVMGLGFALRTAAREMKLSTMKNDFVSNVSHELRTPISSIRVFGEFMRLGRVKDPEKVREYGEYIETESRRLTQLINNILDFSRIESGRKVYHFEEADLEEVIAETLATFAVRLRNSGFEVSFEVLDEFPLVDIDSNAIDRALANLLDNAVKYSNGERDIRVELSKQGDQAVISVEDQGIGIPRSEINRIFERFHRVSTGLVHDVKGSGLGLSLVQHIAEAHGGSVSVESEFGKGSTFFLHLPITSTGGRGRTSHES